MLERHLQTIRHECNKDISLDPFVCLVINGADRKITFQFFECLFDFGQLDIVLPEYGWIARG
jgi:hypothetical protein